MLQTFILALVLFQTRVNQEKQTWGSNIIVNELYYKATFVDNGRFQLLPGWYFNRMLRIQNVTPPPNSQAICGRKMDREVHPAYEFLSTGDVIATEEALYFCTPFKKWKRISLGDF